MINGNTELVQMKNKQVIAIIRPNGDFDTDYQEIKGHINKKKLAVQEGLYNNFRIDETEALLVLGLSEKRIVISESLAFLKMISNLFIRKLSQRPDLEYVRDRIVVNIEKAEIENLLGKAPYIIGIEHLNEQWIKKLWKNLNATFCMMIKRYSGSVEDYFLSFNPNIHLIGRIYFHLVESEDTLYPFALLATYTAYISEDGKEKHLPLKNALIEFEGDQQKVVDLLLDVNKAAKESRFLSELVKSGRIFNKIKLSEKEAYTFLKEIKIYEDAGIGCRIPKWWRNKADTLKMTVTVGNKIASRVDFDALVDFNADLFLGGEQIDPKELKNLLLEAEGLTFIKGKWVEVDHKKLKETLKAYEHAQSISSGSNMSMLEAMRLQIDAEKVLNVSKDLCEIVVTNGEWIDSVISRLTHPDNIEDISCGEGFNATLRTYQERGLNWLYFMKNLGLGACLADDMGLGKTIEVISLLNYCKDKKKEKSLVIVPVSLIGNWTRELDKFAPSLKYCVLHPSENKVKVDDEKVYEKDYDIYITSYGMLIKYEWLSEITWDTVILDEAQAIKNPRTKRTRAVKQLKAKYKIAMTGTPIENRLSDLWSLFDFLNTGLLGTSREFTDFTRSLEKSKDDYAKLKQVVSPFVLRRLKTDKSIITDLPEKIEMKSYSSLSKKQTVLYNKLVVELKEKIESTEAGIQRKGVVLSSIVKFKQICNHPDQYLGQSSYLERDSGKFERLREICESIYLKRERVIIFTQFKEMTKPLNDFLESVFLHKGLILHGGTPVKKRKELVERFQGHDYVPFMVLSIKAGGVGLNLTSANHVIHFDRWWNPSVENQATDRAFRIGQIKNVIVHKFIMKGTIEEKIDMMIEDKTKLSEDIISSNQVKLITEMENKELIDLFTLKL